MPSERFLIGLSSPLTLLIGAGTAVAIAVVGAVSIFRHIDRSPWVVPATVFVSLPRFIFLGELLSIVGVLPSY
jgi:hypothetical protein